MKTGNRKRGGYRPPSQLYNIKPWVGKRKDWGTVERSILGEINTMEKDRGRRAGVCAELVRGPSSGKRQKG